MLLSESFPLLGKLSFSVAGLDFLIEEFEIKQKVIHLAVVRPILANKIFLVRVIYCLNT